MPNRILRMHQVVDRTGIAARTIYKKMRSDPPTFPKQIHLTTRCIGWRESDIEAWIAALAPDKPPARQSSKK